jgi:hypothetical protein
MLRCSLLAEKHGAGKRRPLKASLIAGGAGYRHPFRKTFEERCADLF